MSRSIRWPIWILIAFAVTVLVANLAVSVRGAASAAPIAPDAPRYEYEHHGYGRYGALTQPTDMSVLH